MTPDHVTCDNLFLAVILDYTHGFRNLSTKFKKWRNLSLILIPEVVTKLVMNTKIM